MANRQKSEHLAQVKEALAAKYARRAENANSKPLQEKLWRKSLHYHRQATAIRRTSAG